jgi:hypothetical protein
MRTLAVLVLLMAPAGQPRPVALQGHVGRAGSGAPLAHARIVVARVAKPVKAAAGARIEGIDLRLVIK